VPGVFLAFADLSALADYLTQSTANVAKGAQPSDAEASGTLCRGDSLVEARQAVGMPFRW